MDNLVYCELKDQIAELRREVEVLTAERDHLRESLGRIGESDLVTLLTAERDRALQELGMLRDALEEAQIAAVEPTPTDWGRYS